MRIAFLDFFARDFHVDTPYQEAMGGAQAAVCFAAEALARRGHRVFLFSHTTESSVQRGVTCIPLKGMDSQRLQELRFDAVVLNQNAGFATVKLPLRNIFSHSTRLFLWAHDAWDAATLQSLQLPEERQAYDGFIFLSRWHRESCVRTFGLPPTKSHVIEYGLSPHFCSLFDAQTSIVSHKTSPPVLAYISAPYRGLELLLNVFPELRERVPGVTLQVFSGMKVYQPKGGTEDAGFHTLYQRCLSVEGVEYRGPQPRGELVEALKRVTLLAYPNIFPETFCLSIAEALASGCRVVSSALGALPETTLSLATLIPVDPDMQRFESQFVDAVVQVLQADLAMDPSQREERLRTQVETINAHYSWPIQAALWEKVLS